MNIYKYPFVLLYTDPNLQNGLKVLYAFASLTQLLLGVCLFCTYSSMTVPLLIFAFYLIEKSINILLYKPSSTHTLLLSDLSDIRILFESSKSMNTELEGSLILRIFIRFYLNCYVYAFNFLQLQRELSPIMSQLLLASFLASMVLSAFLMYVFNTQCKDNNLFDLIPFGVFITQFIALFGSLVLFINANESYSNSHIILIKLALTLAVTPLIAQKQHELYVTTDAKMKFTLTSFLIGSSLISESSPFVFYAKTSKLDSSLDEKLSSQAAILFIRYAQFIESIIYVSYSRKLDEMQLFYWIVILCVSVNAILIACTFTKQIRAWATNKYEYFSQLETPVSKAVAIVTNSKNIRFLNCVNKIGQISEQDEHEFLTDDFKRLLLKRFVFDAERLPLGFTKISFYNLITSSTTFPDYRIHISKQKLFPEFLELFETSPMIPQLALGIYEEMLDSQEVHKLSTSMVNRLFNSGVYSLKSQQNSVVFSQVNIQTTHLLTDFSSRINSISVFLSQQAPFISNNPSQILYDLYEDFELHKD